MIKLSDKATSVAVYNFRDITNGYELAVVSSFKATRQAIAEFFRGDPIESTEEWVVASELDEFGRYRRIPTGWGDLESR